MPARMEAVAIPEPIRPPPSTATRLMGRGLSPASVTPDTRLVERWAKKMWIRALCWSRVWASAKARVSCSGQAQGSARSLMWLRRSALNEMQEGAHV